MDGWTDGVILICHLKFLRGHKKNRCLLPTLPSSSIRVKIYYFLSSEHQLTLLHIRTKFFENICNSFKLIERTSFHTKNYEGQNSVNNIGGVKVFVLCILFVDVSYLYIEGHAQRW